MTQTEYSELLKPSTANCADKRISSDVVQLIAQIKYSELLKPSTTDYGPINGLAVT